MYKYLNSYDIHQYVDDACVIVTKKKLVGNDGFTSFIAELSDSATFHLLVAV